MKSLLVMLFIILIQLKLEAQSLQDAQIITSDELESSGCTILSDIYQLIDKWNSSTIDGFNWYVSANGLSPYQRQRFKLMVDGHPLDLNIMDNQNINLLPFNVNNIDFIEIESTPQIIIGDFAEAGLIHIHLKKPAPKLTSHIVYSTGNESGDPGPYKFTTYASQNIDKINTTLAGDLKYGSRNWDLQAGIKQEQNFDTDARIKKRIEFYKYNSEKAQMLSGFGKLSLSIKNNTNSLIGFYSGQKDYFHIKYLGNELPVNRNISSTGINGEIILNYKIRLNYLLQTGRNKLTEWNGFDPDWNNSKLRSNLILTYQTNPFRFSGGISLRKENFCTADNLLNNSISFRNLFVEVKYEPGNYSSHELSLYTVSHNRSRSYKAVFSHYLKLHRCHSLTGSFSIFTRMPEEDLNFLTWNHNGYTLDNSKIVYAAYGDLRTSRTLTGDLHYKFKRDSSITVEVGLFYRSFRDHYLEEQIYSYDHFNGIFFTSTNLLPGNNFSEGGINAGITQQVSKYFRYKINYTFRNPFKGDILFKNTWKEFPAHKAVMTIDYTASYDFGMWSRLSYFSPAEWTAFKYVQYQSGGLYNASVKNSFLLDIALKKFFARRMIRANIVLRNVLNRNEFYHPIGAEFNLRLFIQVVVNLDKLPE